MAPVEEQLVPLAAEEMEVEYWAGEPSTLEELLDQYVVESKFASQCPGGTLYLTAASNRIHSGSSHGRYPGWQRDGGRAWQEQVPIPRQGCQVDS